MPTALPSVTELSNLLNATEAWVALSAASQALFDRAALIGAATEEFQDLTGLRPLEGETVDSTRYYDPPGPNVHNPLMVRRGGGARLELRPHFQSITSITMGHIQGDATSGSVLAENTQYHLLPYNRIEDTAIEAVQFLFPLTGWPGSVKIIGKAGYFATDAIPYDIHQAVLMGAFARLLDQLAAGIGANAYDWSEGASKEKFSVELVQKLSAAPRATFMDAVRDNTIMRI